jgi:hypothetical protein
VKPLLFGREMGIHGKKAHYNANQLMIWHSKERILIETPSRVIAIEQDKFELPNHRQPPF